MKKCVSAVKYGIETLGVSPDHLFSLIKSSKGYDGKEYDRWLAARIIEVAEKDGVKFSQLLVKKFDILSEIAKQDGEQEIGEDYFKFFKEKLETPISELYTIGLGESDKDIDVDSFLTGIDYDSENCFFSSNLVSGLRESVVKGIFPFLFRFDTSAISKKSDIYVDAKEAGIDLKYNGSGILYRLVMLERVWGFCGKFGFLCPVSFLYDKDNKGILDYFLSHFKVSGYLLKSVSKFSGDYAFCVVEPGKSSGLILHEVKPSAEGVLETGREVVASYINMSMYEWLKKRDYADEKPLGYLSHDITLTVTSYSDGDVVPVTNSNLLDIIAYYGIYSSNFGSGFFTDVKVIVSADDRYDSLVFNSLPLFVFDDRVMTRGRLVKKETGEKVIKRNKLGLDSIISMGLKEKGDVFFSFEAKELWNIGVEICNYAKENFGMNYYTMSFSEVIGSELPVDMLDRYVVALRNLKGYICSNYSDMY